MNKKFIQGLQINPCPPYWIKALVNISSSHNFLNIQGLKIRVITWDLLEALPDVYGDVGG
jgi:hypothetical protein